MIDPPAYLEGVIETTCAESLWWPADIDPHGFYVYVMWDRSEAGEAVYIGKSASVLVRVAQHATEADWWPRVGRIDFHRFATQKEMDRAEYVFINALDPCENVVRITPLTGDPTLAGSRLRARRMGHADSGSGD